MQNELFILKLVYYFLRGPSWPWSYGSWIYDYLCNQCLSPLMLRVRISIRARCTTLCGKVYQWFSPGTLVSSIYKNDHHDIIEILLKVALNTIKQTTNIILYCQIWFQYHSSRCHDSIFYVHFGLTVNIWRINFTQDPLVTNLEICVLYIVSIKLTRNSSLSSSSKLPMIMSFIHGRSNVL